MSTRRALFSSKSQPTTIDVSHDAMVAPFTAHAMVNQASTARRLGPANAFASHCLEALKRAVRMRLH
jgi:hypothetical protein